MAITQLFPDRYSSLENTVNNSYMPKPSKLVASAMLATQLLSASTASAEQLGEVGLKIGRKVREVVSIGPTQKPATKVQPAPQNDWVIDKANITIYDPQGKEIKTYLQQPEGATIPVPENGRVQITHPQYARNTKTGGTLALDVLIQNKNNHYETNARRMADRTERAFPLDFEAEDAKLLVWNGDKQIYRMYLVGERSNTTDSIEVSTKPYLLEVYKFKMPAAAPQQPAAVPPVIVVVPVPVPHKTTPKHPEKPTEKHDPDELPKQDHASRVIGAASFLMGYQEHAVTLDPNARQQGFLVRGMYDSSKFHAAAGARFTQDASFNPNQGKLSSIEFSANADYRVVGTDKVAAIVSGNLGRAQHRMKSNNESRTVFNEGFPSSKSFGLSAGGGVVVGKNTESNLRVTYEKAKLLQEGGYYLFPYGDLALSTRELGGSNIMAHLFIDGKSNPSIEAIYTQMNLENDAKDVDVSSRSTTVRFYVPLGKEKKVQAVIGGNVGKFEDRGPGLHRGYFNRWYVEGGVAWKSRK
jgi:hypothetical protein